LTGCRVQKVFAEAMPLSISVPFVFIMVKSLLSVEKMVFVIFSSADAIFHVYIARISR
jgi:hypothetical protein